MSSSSSIAKKARTKAEADFATWLFGETEFPSSPLLSDRWLRAVDENHPDVSPGLMTMEQFLQLPHLVYGIGIDRHLNLADQHLAKLGIQRRIDVTVESFLLVPFLIQGTQLVSLVLERAAKRLAETTHIRTLDPPLELPDIHEAMYWESPAHDRPGTPGCGNV